LHFERHVLKPGLIFKGKGFKPPGYHAPFSCGSGGVNAHRPLPAVVDGVAPGQQRRAREGPHHKQHHRLDEDETKSHVIGSRHRAEQWASCKATHSPPCRAWASTRAARSTGRAPRQPLPARLAWGCPPRSTRAPCCSATISTVKQRLACLCICVTTDPKP
jgi:hypothetical protein